MAKNLQLRISDDIAHLIFNLTDEKVNKLSEKILVEFDHLLEKIEKNLKIKALIISSLKKNIFIAGADINEIKEITNKKLALKKVEDAQNIFFRLENLKIPTICLINGACLGGGLEFALSCKYRIAVKNSKTKLGLPEVNLGIFPGFGGTQRLPRLVGLEQSLKMILSGKAIDATKSYKYGLVDLVTNEEFIDINLDNFIKEILKDDINNKFLRKRRQASTKRLITETIFLKKYLVFYFAQKNLVKKTKNFYPAPLAALKVIKQTYNKRNKIDGCKIEAKEFSKLVIGKTSKNLIHIFFASEEVKKKYNIKNTPTILKAGILGAGIMGGGIAFTLSKIDIKVRMKDISNIAIALGYQQCLKIYNQLLKIRRYSKSDISRKMNKIDHDLNYNNLKDSDIIIEAIVENINIKKSTFSELEKHINKNCIIASNTSSLSINSMSSSLKYPDRFIGMHFFNPVNRMPLVEIIKGEKTNQKTIDKTVALALRMGKTPIVVQDVAGFLVNRILLPFINESGFLLEEDGDIKKIDKIISDFGMPMGPFILSDVVGIDVGHKVAISLFEAYGRRMKICSILTKISENKKILGKKSNLGFYKYNKFGKNLGINPRINEKIKKIRSNRKILVRRLSKEEIIERSIFIMINEASRCLEENVVSSATELDIAMIFGAGFPPFRGGLLKYADVIGSKRIVEKLRNYQKSSGSRFTPSKLLAQMAKTNQKFYD
ncbi:3-hydroxyacyl-CoA dehydrogenase NAD-binding domain-containing protein [Rickettsiales bacterium]|nr:3-hydroxyacyl-CoA dehydrogenase NAD-binding domain-containing protein [Rickettsiales bacterium]